MEGTHLPNKVQSGDFVFPILEVYVVHMARRPRGTMPPLRLQHLVPQTGITYRATSLYIKAFTATFYIKAFLLRCISTY